MTTPSPSGFDWNPIPLPSRWSSLLPSAQLLLLDSLRNSRQLQSIHTIHHSRQRKKRTSTPQPPKPPSPKRRLNKHLVNLPPEILALYLESSK